MTRIFIGGVPFMALGHHDGRFVRTGGLFAFARQSPFGDYTVLHLEMTAEINRYAGPGHARWGWSLGEGMNSLLVHLAGQPAVLAKDADPGLETVRWHPEAQVVMSGSDPDLAFVEHLEYAASEPLNGKGEALPYQRGSGS